MVRLGYCNALPCGAREDVIRQLKRFQRQVVRVVCKKYKNDHTSVTELMWGLYMVSHRGHNCISSALTILDSALTS